LLNKKLREDKFKEYNENQKNLNKSRIYKTLLGIDKKNENDENDKNGKCYSLGDDWLTKWSIVTHQKHKKHEEAFKKYDIFEIGHLSGELLVDAISSVTKLNNIQMEYLFNILNLCEIDPYKRGADFEMFRIIISLAEKIQCLDDEWFQNVLPKLDIKSVENKAFKIRRLWSHLVNAKSKQLTNRELMIEFKVEFTFNS